MISLRPVARRLLRRLRDDAGRLEERGSGALSFGIAAHFQRPALSSPEALRRSLDNRRRAITRRLVAEPGELSRLTAEAEIAVTDLDAGDDLNDEQRSHRIDAAGITGFDELQEIEELGGLADATVMAVAEVESLPVLTFDFEHFRATRPARGYWRLVVDEARFQDATGGG